MDNKEVTRIFKALGDENRLAILNILKSGEKCACNLLDTLPFSQPTLSHHMKLLTDAKVINARKEGKWVYYSLNQAGLDQALELLNSLKTI